MLSLVLLVSCGEKSVKLSFRIDPQFMLQEEVEAATSLEVDVQPLLENVEIGTKTTLKIALAEDAFSGAVSPSLNLIPDDAEADALFLTIRLYEKKNHIAGARLEASIGDNTLRTVFLIKTCQVNTDCNGSTSSLFCNGSEQCICPVEGCSTTNLGICNAAPPCSYASCVELSCNEATASCAAVTSLNLNHDKCLAQGGEESYCHPFLGCQVGVGCNRDDECKDDNVCNGSEICSDVGQCETLQLEEPKVACGTLICGGGVWRVEPREDASIKCGDGKVCVMAQTPFTAENDETLPVRGIDFGAGAEGLKCQVSRCGDGVVDVYNEIESFEGELIKLEFCDPNALGEVVEECNPDTCQKRRCGDGIVDKPYTDEKLNEECDGEEGCHPVFCRWNVCGDAFKFGAEECDDGNASNEDDCLVGCTFNVLNDGFQNRTGAELEDCDDGNTSARDGCNNGNLESWKATCVADLNQVTTADLLNTEIPEMVFMTKSGDLLLASPAESQVYRIKIETEFAKIRAGTTPIISLVAGSGRFADDGDGQEASEAGLFVPIGAAADSLGNIYIVDKGAGRIRKVNSAGIIMPFAGNGKRFEGRDGLPATFSGLDEPIAVTTDRQGNVFVAELGGYRVRRIDGLTGEIDTVFGVRYDGENDPDFYDINRPLSVRADHGFTDCTWPQGTDPRGLRFQKLLNVVALPNDDLIVRTQSEWHVYPKDVHGNRIETLLAPENKDGDPPFTVNRFYLLHENDDGSWSHYIIGNERLHDPEYVQQHGLSQAQYRYYLDPKQDLISDYGSFTRKGYFNYCSSRDNNSRALYDNDDDIGDGDLYFSVDSLQISVDNEGSLLFTSCQYGNVWRVHLDLTLETAQEIARSAIPELLYDSGLDQSIPASSTEAEVKRNLLDKSCFDVSNIFNGNLEVNDVHRIQSPTVVLAHPEGGVFIREFKSLFKWILGPDDAPIYAELSDGGISDSDRIYPEFGKVPVNSGNGLLLKIASTAPGGVGLNNSSGFGAVTDYQESLAAFAMYDDNLVVQFSSTGRAEVYGGQDFTLATPSVTEETLFTDASSVFLRHAKFNHPSSIAWNSAGSFYVTDSDNVIRFLTAGDAAKAQGEMRAGLEMLKAYTVLGEKGRETVLASELSFDEISFNEPSGLWFVPGSCVVNDVPNDENCVSFSVDVEPCSVDSSKGCVACDYDSGRCAYFEDGAGSSSFASPVKGDHLLVADTGNHRVLDVDLYVDTGTGRYTSTAKTIIGNGIAGSTHISLGTVPAVATRLNRPVSVIQLSGKDLGFNTDGIQIMLVVDRGNHVIHVFAKGLLFSELTLLRQFGVPGAIGDVDVVPDPVCFNAQGENLCTLDPVQPPEGGCELCQPALSNARFRFPIGITPAALSGIGNGSAAAGSDEIVLYISDDVDRVRALTLDVSNPLRILGTLKTLIDGSLRPSDGIMERIESGVSLPGAYLTSPQAVVKLPEVEEGENFIRQEWLIADGSSGRVRRLTRRFFPSTGQEEHFLQTVLGLPRGERLRASQSCIVLGDADCVASIALNQLREARGIAWVSQPNGRMGIFVSDPKAGVLYQMLLPSETVLQDRDECGPGESWISSIQRCEAWQVNVALRSQQSDADLPTGSFQGFKAPSALQYDEARDALYVADQKAHVIWKVVGASSVPSTGILPVQVSVLLGKLDQEGHQMLGGEENRRAEETRLYQPDGLLVAGNTLFVSDTGNHRVLALDLDALEVSQILGTGVGSNAGQGGPAYEIPVNTPRNMALDRFENLLITAGDRLRVLTPKVLENGMFHYGKGTVLDLMQNGGFAGSHPSALALDEQCMAVHNVRCLSDVSVFHEDGVEKVIAFDSCLGIAFTVNAVN